MGANFNLFACRALLGVAIGASSAVFTPHVCELASPEWRGLLVTSGGVVFNTGVLVAYSLGGVFGWQVWHEAFKGLSAYSQLITYQHY